MGNQETACIYCSNAFDPTRGEGDHVIPAALGEFRSDRRFRGICPDCNNYIGRSEQQFLNCGPESFFRKYVKPAPSRRQQRPSHQGAMGAPGPKWLMTSGNHRQLVKPDRDNPTMTTPIDQLVVMARDGVEHHIKLYDGLRHEQLRRRVARELGFKSEIDMEFGQAILHCDESSSEQYTRLVKQALPRVELRQGPATEAGTYAAEGRIEFTCNDHYFRAIAKIAFHYYLTQNRRGLRGSETAFAPIRGFILEGGRWEEFFDRPGPRFDVPFGEIAPDLITAPDRWCHILAVCETSGVVMGYVNLFAGPECTGEPFHIRLAVLNSRIIVPNGTSGHIYLYEKEQPTAGYAGHVEPVNLHRIR